MRTRWPILSLLLAAGFVPVAQAGNLQRIGHTTLVPRHTSPDDKGMYAAVIDPTNGYAYFFGNYLTKLDITGNLPVAVGASLVTGQFTEGAIDPAAGYAYMPKPNASGGVIYRYALGAGTNSVSAAGSLTLAEPAWLGMSVVIDNSDPNPNNHYALCHVQRQWFAGKGRKNTTLHVHGSLFSNARRRGKQFCLGPD